MQLLSIRNRSGQNFKVFLFNNLLLLHINTIDSRPLVLTICLVLMIWLCLGLTIENFHQRWVILYRFVLSCAHNPHILLEHFRILNLERVVLWDDLSGPLIGPFFLLNLLGRIKRSGAFVVPYFQSFILPNVGPALSIALVAIGVYLETIEVCHLALLPLVNVLVKLGWLRNGFLLLLVWIHDFAPINISLLIRQHNVLRGHFLRIVAQRRGRTSTQNLTCKGVYFLLAHGIVLRVYNNSFLLGWYVFCHFRGKQNL